jgi:hypothetical protein
MANPTSSAAKAASLHQWHWISSAICLIGMLLFSITGFTLNHAAQIEAKPQVTRQKATLPAPLLRAAAPLRASHADAKAAAAADDWPPGPTPPSRSTCAAARTPNGARKTPTSPCPAPGGDAWLRIGRRRPGRIRKTDRGWISWLNDMHKGRNTGAAWSWFIDIFAGACLVFCITGFLILKYHAANRPSTWPVIGFGIVLPIVLALLFVH